MKYQPAGQSNTERPPVDCYVETGTGHVTCHLKHDDDDMMMMMMMMTTRIMVLILGFLEGFLTYILHGPESFLRS
jgi:hypothetical protein